MKMPTVMGAQHSFSRVPSASIERSVFNRSHAHKTTFDAGYLIPVYVDTALPGDTFTMSMAGFARLATPLKPIMDNLYLDTFFFAVPYRLVWDNFVRFMGEQDAPGESIDFVIPQFTGFIAASGSMSDYMGIPVAPGVVSAVTLINSLHHRAYNLCWNEWFRDQNLQDPAIVDKDDGPDAITDYILRRRGKRHDYFTGALPWPQKGTAVSLPLGSSANVVGNPAQPLPILRGMVSAQSGGLISETAGFTSDVGWDVGGSGALVNDQLRWGTGALDSGLIADLTNATAATVNELRQAFAVQRLLERDARGGTRYVELVKSQFGVTSPDARLQRPEYLGGGSANIVVSPVAQTSRSEVDESPQGNLAGIGTSSFRGHGFSKSFTEHTLLLGLVSVRADLTYQQGLNRMFSQQTRYDLYWPPLAHLGEQVVWRKEIYMTGATANDGEAFGYQERYAEYRYKPSLITGAFRSVLAAPLDIWHLSQKFGSAPVLGNVFIQEDPPIDRVVAVDTEPHFLADFWFELKCARPMPVFGVPGLGNNF